MGISSIGSWLRGIFKKEKESIEISRKLNGLMHLSIGSQTFVSIRKWAQIYVDKTGMVYEYAKEPGMYFLIRPRKFGKSILLTTLKSLFKDGLQQFKGLEIEKLWKDTKKYDVVHLDFSIIPYTEDVDIFHQRLAFEISNNFQEYGFGFDNTSKKALSEQLSDWLSKRPAKSLVLLIDEYDLPLLHSLGNPASFKEIGRQMADFYQAFIDNEKAFRLLWVTGITKINHPKLLPVLNKLKDISLDPKAATLLGFTREEIKTSYADYVEKAALVLKVSSNELLDKICEAYDGYCFELTAKKVVMCPWSVLNYLEYPEGKFKPYWAESGQVPANLMNPKTAGAYWDLDAFGKTKRRPLSYLKGETGDKPFDSKALLTQCGYLTIKSYDKKDEIVTLDYPNNEVHYWMGGIYINLLTHVPDLSKGQGEKLLKILNKGESKAVVETIKETFQSYNFLNQFIFSDWDIVNMVQKVLDGWQVEENFEKYTSGENEIEFTIENLRWNLFFKYSADGEPADKLIKKRLKKMDAEEEKLKKFGMDFKGVIMIYSGKDRKFTQSAVSK